MKLAANIAKQASKEIFGDEDKLVHCFFTHKGYKALETPMMASEMKCVFCGCKEGYTCLVDKDVRGWMCGRVCPSSKLPKWSRGTTTPPQSKRALTWPLFCEINGIGDLYHEVKFDLIDQSKGKIDFLRKFSQEPHGILLMHGPAGTGKTYACMGLCELYTRKHTSAKFFTHRSLARDWLATFKEDKPSGFVDKIESVSLLVIDDFGTSDPTPAFLTFFMDLINSRMQWKNRGTVITTNLTPKKLAEVCGEALSDRLKTGQEFVFSGKSRRTPPPL